MPPPTMVLTPLTIRHIHLHLLQEVQAIFAAFADDEMLVRKHMTRRDEGLLEEDNYRALRGLHCADPHIWSNKTLTLTLFGGLQRANPNIWSTQQCEKCPMSIDDLNAVVIPMFMRTHSTPTLSPNPSPNPNRGPNARTLGRNPRAP